MTTDWPLVLKHVAALRRHGWPAARALETCAASLEGPARSRVLEVQRALAAGAPIAIDDREPALFALSRGDDLDEGALLAVARALEARALLEDAARSALRQVLVVVLALLALLSLAAPVSRSMVEVFASSSAEALPGVTVLVLDALGFADRWFLGPILLILVAGLLVTRAWERRAPGQRVVRRVARLRWIAARGAAGRNELDLLHDDELALDELERAYAGRLLARHPPAAAATLLADALERSDAGALLRRRHALALALGAVGLFLVINAVVALYLPLFSIAGSIG